MFQGGYFPKTTIVKDTEMSGRVNLKRGYKATEQLLARLTRGKDVFLHWLWQESSVGLHLMWQNAGESLRMEYYHINT